MNQHLVTILTLIGILIAVIGVGFGSILFMFKYKPAPPTTRVNWNDCQECIYHKPGKGIQYRCGKTGRKNFVGHNDFIECPLDGIPLISKQKH